MPICLAESLRLAAHLAVSTAVGPSPAIVAAALFGKLSHGLANFIGPTVTPIDNV